MCLDFSYLVEAEGSAKSAATLGNCRSYKTSTWGEIVCEDPGLWWFNWDIFSWDSKPINIFGRENGDVSHHMAIHSIGTIMINQWLDWGYFSDKPT